MGPQYTNKETGESVKVKKILGVYNGYYVYTKEGCKIMSGFGLEKFYDKR